MWDEPCFRHPDVILNDGRFRGACLMPELPQTACPVRVLFNIYADRPKYRFIEAVGQLKQMSGGTETFSYFQGWQVHRISAL